MYALQSPTKMSIFSAFTWNIFCCHTILKTMYFQCSPSLTKEAEDDANDSEDPSSDQSCLSVVVLIVP